MSTGPIAFLPTPHGMMWKPQYVSIAGSPSGSGPAVQVPDFGDLGGRAERVARRCARYEKYYVKQAAKYAAKGSKRAKRKMDKYKAKILACVQAGAYTPRDPALLVSAVGASGLLASGPGGALLPTTQPPPVPYLPEMEAQAETGAEGTGGIPGGPLPWIIGGIAVLGAIALIATKPPSKDEQ